MDLQILLQEHTQLLRTLNDERRNSERRIVEERERSRWNEEKIRAEAKAKIGELENQIKVLLKMLSDQEQTISSLRGDLLIAKSAQQRVLEVELDPAVPQAGKPSSPQMSIPLKNTECLKCSPVMPAQVGPHMIGTPLAQGGNT